MDLADLYRGMLVENPTMGDLAAVNAAIALCGRDFHSPSIADHREALAAARATPKG